jgi:hypothetical protein
MQPRPNPRRRLILSHPEHPSGALDLGAGAPPRDEWARECRIGEIDRGKPGSRESSGQTDWRHTTLTVAGAARPGVACVCPADTGIPVRLALSADLATGIARLLSQAQHRGQVGCSASSVAVSEVIGGEPETEASSDSDGEQPAHWLARL